MSPNVVIGLINTLEGRSPATSARNVGEAFDPEAGPANTTLGAWVFNVSVKVPEVVMGDPVIVYSTSAAPEPVAAPPRPT